MTMEMGTADRLVRWGRWDTTEADNAETIKEVHQANPGTDRTAELDILAMEGGWLY